MKRIAVCAAFAVLAFGAPAHGATTFSHPGSVLLPVVSPQVARAAYPVRNGVFGDVFALPQNAGGMSYTLKRTSGTTNTENLEVYFYAANPDGGISAASCQDLNAREPDPATETGGVCTNIVPAWAIVVIGRLGGPYTGYAGGMVGYTFTLSI